MCSHQCTKLFFFFFNDTATTEIYTLSLHDALPIFVLLAADPEGAQVEQPDGGGQDAVPVQATGAQGGVHGIPDVGQLPDRKSTRLNSSHANISYAVFCLKKKTN